MSVYLTALLKAKPGAAEELKGLLNTLVEASTQEPACLQYELYQSTTDEHQFIFHETWADEDGLTLHNGQPHLQIFKEQATAILDGDIVIHKIKRIVNFH